MSGIENSIEIVNQSVILSLETTEYEIGVDIVQGRKGDKGEKGDSASITVGEVKTLEPADLAFVQNVGTKNDAIFNFGIPRGKTGTLTVVDNLDSESAKDALSANQGRVLLAKINELWEFVMSSDINNMLIDANDEIFFTSEEDNFILKTERITNV